MTNINQRASQIIKILLNSKNPVSSLALSQEIGCSTKTIQSEIKSLNKEIKNGKILSIRGVGYKLEGDFSKLNLNDIYYNDIDRVHYILKTMLNISYKIDNAIRLEELADKMHVSVSTVKNDLKEVKKILKSYDIEILTKHKQGIYIEQDEEKIIKFILKLCHNNDNDLSINDFLNDKIKDNLFILKNEVLKELNNEKLILSDIEFKNITNYIFVYLSRNDNNKNFIKKHINKYKNKRNKVINNSSNREAIINSINEFCENLKLATSIDIRNDEIFKDFLYNHIDSLYKKIHLGIENNDTNNFEIKIKYPYAFELAKIAKRTVENNLNIKISEHEISNIAIHIVGALQRASYIDKKKVFNTIIVCTSGIGTSMLIKSKLENIFKEKLKIVKVIPAYLAPYINASDIDFIISTVEVDIENIPVINISPFLNDKEVKKIEKYMETENIYEDINIQSLFEKELFFENIDLNTKEEVIEFMGDKLLKRGYIDREMKSAFLCREKIATTEIGNMVAIPHSSGGNIYSNKIAVGILKNPIKWEIGDVRLVIMLSIDSDKTLDYEDLFLNIYKRVDSIAKVISICENKSFEKFVNMFK